jgi:hypothetical protein
VVPTQLEVLGGNLADWLRARRWALSHRYCQAQFLASRRLAEQLGSYFARKHLSQQRRYGISELTLRICVVPRESDVIGKGLQTRHLANTQASVRPVERTSRRSGLCLDGPRGQALRQLQQEGPIAPTPSEEWLAAAP